MARRQPETLLSSDAQKLLRQWGAEVCKQHGGPFSRKGEPDLIGCFKGRCFAIELKIPGEEITLAQRIRLQNWHKAGAMVGVATTASEAVDIGIHNIEVGWDQIWLELTP